MRTASWRYVLSLLSFLGIFAVGTILGMFLWMVAQIDQIEYEKTHALIELKLAETHEQLRLGVEDYAYWTFSYNLVEAGDSASILENLGSGATDAELFDQLFILSANGDLLHAFDKDLGANGHSLFEESNFRPVWAALNEAKAQEYLSVVSVLEHEGTFALVAAAWITPDTVAELPDAQFPALLGVIHLAEERLEALMMAAQVSEANLVQYASDGPERPEDDRLTIYDLNGGPVAMLTWSMLSLGTELRQQLLPFVLLVGIGILGICGFAARYFHSQHSALEQAKKVAATDQLTGLLNRAGLAEKLGRKDVLRSLERGHLAAIYVDLNKFKDLNDTFGHRAGDMALRVTAERLQSVVRGSDFVARLGGDEFTCVVINSDPESAAMVIAQRILDLSAAPISLNGHDQIVMPSIGLAVAAPGTHWEAVLSQSDAAMFWSKRKKADYPIVFRKSMDVGNF